MKNGHLVKPVAEYVHNKYTNNINIIYKQTVKELQKEIIGLNDYMKQISYY